jgi:hypothetical protein
MYLMLYLMCPDGRLCSGVVRDDGVMVWGVDDFGAWLVGQLADASRRRLTELILGGKFEQALRQAGAAAVWAAASELSPGDPDRAAHLARVLNEVFAVRVPDAAAAGGTVLEVIQAGVVAQVAVLEDPCLTTVAGVSSAAAEGIADGVIAPLLIRRLLSEILASAAQGGPLAALAAQLNADVTHMQGQQTEVMLSRLNMLGMEILDAIARISPAVGAPDMAFAAERERYPVQLQERYGRVDFSGAHSSESNTRRGHASSPPVSSEAVDAGPGSRPDAAPARLTDVAAIACRPGSLLPVPCGSHHVLILKIGKAVGGEPLQLPAPGCQRRDLAQGSVDRVLLGGGAQFSLGGGKVLLVDLDESLCHGRLLLQDVYLTTLSGDIQHARG